MKRNICDGYILKATSASEIQLKLFSKNRFARIVEFPLYSTSNS